MRNIRVAVWGFGAMGGGITKVLLEKTGVEITGVCDLHPNRVGKSIFSLLSVERGSRKDVIVSNDIDSVLQENSADVCIVATDSFTKDVYPKLVKVLSRGINAISTAEEMSYPAAKEPELAKELDRIAKAHGVTALGTGINPRLDDGSACDLPDGVHDTCGQGHLQARQLALTLWPAGHAGAGGGLDAGGVCRGR